MSRELKTAMDTWFASTEGEDCKRGDILAEMRHSSYLRNRLERAFIAGANAQQRINGTSVLGSLSADELLDVAARMCQELQHFADEAEKAGSPLLGVVELIEEFEQSYKQTALSWQREIQSVPRDDEQNLIGSL